ncbi:MAG: NAD(P)H-hydrate epimerase, partial [Actinomycetota bacterium]
MATLPDGALMERASTGLADTCAALLADAGAGIKHARVVIVTGSGNNGGDALYAGAFLAERGARVHAIALADRLHDGGGDALVAAGGRIVSASDTLAASELLVDADLVLDGIVGIGGSGALRPLAAELVHAAVNGGALVVAVDIPSGIDADTGAVADPQAAV